MPSGSEPAKLLRQDSKRRPAAALGFNLANANDGDQPAADAQPVFWLAPFHLIRR